MSFDWGSVVGRGYVRINSSIPLFPVSPIFMHNVAIARELAGAFWRRTSLAGRIEPSRRQPNLRGGDHIRGKSFETAVAPS
jgi:hypothetical protein